MKREKAITLLQCSVIELTGTLAATKEPTAALQLQRYIDAYDMGIEALRAEEGVAKLAQLLRKQTQDLEAAIHGHHGWISVQDRMPEDSEKVLVYTQSGKNAVARWSQRQERFVASGNLNVTHWMPLPAAPEEKV